MAEGEVRGGQRQGDVRIQKCSLCRISQNLARMCFPLLSDDALFGESRPVLTGSMSLPATPYLEENCSIDILSNTLVILSAPCSSLRALFTGMLGLVLLAIHIHQSFGKCGGKNTLVRFIIWKEDQAGLSWRMNKKEVKKGRRSTVLDSYEAMRGPWW